MKQIKLTINGKLYNTEVVETPEEFRRGLGGRAVLPNSSAMLFDFGSATEYRTMVMRNMLIPLDFVFADFKGEVSQTIENCLPPAKGTREEDLLIYRSLLPCKYVLELAAGEVKRNKIRRGSVIQGLPGNFSTAIVIQKSVDSEQNKINRFIDFVKSREDLIPKKVQVHREGSIYEAVRWVRPEEQNVQE